MENEKFRLFISQPMSGLSIEKIKELYTYNQSNMESLRV